MKNNTLAIIIILFWSYAAQAQNQWQFFSTLENYPQASADEITLLPDAVFNASSTAFLLNGTPKSFILKFEYKTCDDDGGADLPWNSADGIAIGLGQVKKRYRKIYANNPSTLTGNNRGSVKQHQGVSIHFATYGTRNPDAAISQGVYVLGKQNRVLAKDHAIVTYTDCEWQEVRISLSPSGALRIYKGTRIVETMLTPKQVRQINTGQLSFSAATGSADSEHAIRDVQIIRYRHAVIKFKGAFSSYTSRLTNHGLILKQKNSHQQRLINLSAETVLAFDDVVFALPTLEDLVLENSNVEDAQEQCQRLKDLDNNIDDFDIRNHLDNAQSLLFNSSSLVLFKKSTHAWGAVGTISSNFVPMMEYMIDNLPELSKFELITILGSSDDTSNYRALRLMRKHGINTELAHGGEIYSGGVNFFIAGAVSTLGQNPTVGVHPWVASDIQPTASGGCIIVEKSALQFPRNHPAHQDEIQFLKDMGIKQSFYWFTLHAKPNTNDEESDIHVMSKKELIRFGLSNYSD